MPPGLIEPPSGITFETLLTFWGEIAEVDGHFAAGVDRKVLRHLHEKVRHIALRAENEILPQGLVFGALVAVGQVGRRYRTQLILRSSHEARAGAVNVRNDGKLRAVISRDKRDVLKLFRLGSDRLAIAGVWQDRSQLSSVLDVNHVGVSQHSGGCDQ